jgi:peptidoglycan/LPS O-acetylase OafA/YrhL
MIGVCFALLLAGIVNAPMVLKPLKRLKGAAKFISDISFSLYLVHFPFVVLIGSLFYGVKRYPASAIGIAIYFGWLLVLLLVGVVFWWAFEKRTPVLRQYVESWRSSKTH